MVGSNNRRTYFCDFSQYNEISRIPLFQYFSIPREIAEFCDFLVFTSKPLFDQLEVINMKSQLQYVVQIREHLGSFFLIWALEIYQIRECQNFPYFIEKSVKTGRFL